MHGTQTINRAQPHLGILAEELLAELTDAAYGVAQKHGVPGPFVDVELDLWAALRQAMQKSLYYKAFAAPSTRVAACS